jgi:2'-5' RNA ligase
MSVIRAFIAIELPNEIQEVLAQLLDQLKKNVDERSIRWVPVNNIHLTLKFLGDVSVNNLEVLQEIIRAEARVVKPMEFSVGRLGAFPNERHPRVVWVGVEAPQDLIVLQRGVEARVTKIGYPIDKRKFFPHLTIGRVSRNASPEEIRIIGDIIRLSKVGFLGAASITAVHFYKSDLLPSGAEYTKMFTAPLGN